jgi:hypothetical protein
MASICCSPEHLLLSAGQLAAQVPCPLGESREERVHAIKRPRRRRRPARRTRTRHEILVDGERGKDLPHLRHQADTCLGDAIRRPCTDRATVEAHAAVVRREHADHALDGRGLAHSVAA